MTSWLTNNNMSLSVGIQYFSHETPNLMPNQRETKTLWWDKEWAK